MPEVVILEQRGEIETVVNARLDAFKQSVTRFREAVESGEARMPTTHRHKPPVPDAETNRPNTNNKRNE